MITVGLALMFSVCARAGYCGACPCDGPRAVAICVAGRLGATEEDVRELLDAPGEDGARGRHSARLHRGITYGVWFEPFEAPEQWRLISDDEPIREGDWEEPSYPPQFHGRLSGHPISDAGLPPGWRRKVGRTPREASKYYPLRIWRRVGADGHSETKGEPR